MSRLSWLLLLIFLSGSVQAALVDESVTPVHQCLHDFHISKTRLEYSAERGEWQLSLHLFIDDLELALSQTSEEKLFLGTAREIAVADSLIKAYLQAKVELIADQQALELEWLGKEVTDDLSAFWIYLYVPEASLPRALEVSNRIFLEQFDDQQNIVQVLSPPAGNAHLLFHRGHQRENIQF